MKETVDIIRQFGHWHCRPINALIPIFPPLSFILVFKDANFAEGEFGKISISVIILTKPMDIVNPEYENLIDSLIRDGYLKTLEIIEAFKAIDRADFVPEEYKSEAYVNAPLPLGLDQTISQPLTVAFMLELLEPKPGEKILDIGAGSGWTTALLAYIVSQHKEVELPKEVQLPKIIAIERILELKQMAEKNISKYNFIEKGIVKIILADGSKGYKKKRLMIK